MKLLSSLLTLVFVISPVYADDLCRNLQQLEKQTNAETPKKIDSATELVQIRVNCEGNTVAYIKRITVDHDQFKDGWKTRKQRQHNQLHCNNDGLASTQQWIAHDIIYDVNFNWLAEFITPPESCSQS